MNSNKLIAHQGKLILLAIFLRWGMCAAQAQVISPEVIASSGGSGSTGGVTLDWTVGEALVTTLDGSSNIITQGFHQAGPVKVRLNLKALLEGPYEAGSGLMSDGLRSNGLLSTSEPYTALGFGHFNDTPKPTTSAVLSLTGSDAIVDWIYVQLRDANDNTMVAASRCGLLQRDGDVVDVDGVPPLGFNAPEGDHYIAVFHRNHLAAMTFAVTSLSTSATSIDLTDGSTAMHGTEPQKVIMGTRMLWAGDATGDGKLQYTGLGNDRDPILVRIGGSVPTNTVAGYYSEDVNMNGTVQYTGLGNDRDLILVNIGGSVPTNTRQEQMP